MSCSLQIKRTKCTSFIGLEITTLFIRKTNSDEILLGNENVLVSAVKTFGYLSLPYLVGFRFDLYNFHLKIEM